MSTIPLIDSADGFEVVRDKVALVLATEQAAQQALATAAAEDPDLWKLRVYTERANAFEMFREGVTDFSPVINVWYDNSNTEMRASDLGARQQMTSQINIDCIGYAESESSGTGHLPGDEYAARTAQRAARLVRGILMHGKYRYLDLNGVVGRRYLLSRTSFQPQGAPQSVQRIVGVRISLSVDHLETVNIEDYPEIEQIYVTMKHAPDGMIIAEMDIDVSVAE